MWKKLDKVNTEVSKPFQFSHIAVAQSISSMKTSLKFSSKTRHTFIRQSVCSCLISTFFPSPSRRSFIHGTLLEIDFHFMCLFICFIFYHHENKKIDNLKQKLLWGFLFGEEKLAKKIFFLSHVFPVSRCPSLERQKWMRSLGRNRAERFRVRWAGKAYLEAYFILPLLRFLYTYTFSRLPVLKMKIFLAITSTFRAMRHDEASAFSPRHRGCLRQISEKFAGKMKLMIYWPKIKQIFSWHEKAKENFPPEIITHDDIPFNLRDKMWKISCLLNSSESERFFSSEMIREISMWFLIFEQTEKYLHVPWRHGSFSRPRWMPIILCSRKARSPSYRCKGQTQFL